MSMHIRKNIEIIQLDLILRLKRFIINVKAESQNSFFINNQTQTFTNITQHFKRCCCMQTLSTNHFSFPPHYFPEIFHVVYHAQQTALYAATRLICFVHVWQAFVCHLASF